MHKTILTALFFFLLSTFASWAQGAQEKTSAKETLLTLSVLPLANKIGLEEYDYLGQTIATALDTRLKQTFRYAPYSNSKAGKEIRSILKKRNQKWTEIDESHLLTLARAKGIDVLIHGYYEGSRKNKKGNFDQMLTRVGVFFGLEERTYWIEDEVNLDSSMFIIFEEIADDLVEEVNDLLQGK